MGADGSFELINGEVEGAPACSDVEGGEGDDVAVGQVLPTAGDGFKGFGVDEGTDEALDVGALTLDLVEAGHALDQLLGSGGVGGDVGQVGDEALKRGAPRAVFIFGQYINGAL